MRGKGYIFRLTAMLLLGLAVVTAPTGSVAQTRPSSNKVNGAYRLVFAGYFTGRGNAAVNPRSVNITGHLTDESGSTATFTARCARDGNHFSGTGSGPGGLSVTVKGRLDAVNKSLRASRLSFTYLTPTGGAGRAIGDRRGAP